MHVHVHVYNTAGICMYMYINKMYPSVGKSSRLLSVTQEWPDSPTTEPCRCYSGKYIIMRDENGRKKEASKVKQTNKAKQSNTAHPRQSVMSHLGWDSNPLVHVHAAHMNGLRTLV